MSSGNGPPGPHPGFEIAIGRLAMNFGALEVRLAATVQDLVSPNLEIGRAVIAGRQFDALLVLFRTLVQAKAVGVYSDLAGEADSLIEYMRGLNGERNQIIHAAWLDDPGTDIHAVKTRLNRSKGLITLGPMTPPEIAKVADNIHSASESLRHMAVRLRAIKLAADHSGDEDSAEYLATFTPQANSTISSVSATIGHYPPPPA